MDAQAGSERGDRMTRLRWRVRGAWQWPAFALLTLADAALLHWLPLAGDGTGWVAALLLAGCLNTIALAVVGPIGGWALRRRRPDLPRVVADDYAGVAVLTTLAGVFLAIGLAHRDEVVEERADFTRQSAAVRDWVADHGDAVARAQVDRANSLRLDEDLFRTCVPAGDRRRWLCVIVDTRFSPPRVTRDANRESNASLGRAGGFR